MIHYNSPKHQKERANVVPLNMDDLKSIQKYLNAYLPIEKTVFDLFQRLIWDYENLQHMRETAPVWISVNDRLPENDTAVLIYTDRGILTCYYDSAGDFYSGAAILTKFVTHWKPLPQTPTK